jgi:hypothetical protein
MAYNIKDVFYLSTHVLIAKTTAGGGSAQLDLSAYIDPIARGRSKGTGLGIYKVHWAMTPYDTLSKPMDDAEAGTVAFAMIAGAGVGDKATGAAAALANDEFAMTNSLIVTSGQWLGAKSQVANASTPAVSFTEWVSPSEDVPYVIVRDNVCLQYMVGENFVDEARLSIRLECAQITLDQATLNQLLRTQTV